ncbi:unnamed protein product [Owenia fusiformis]|uniref:Chitin-binding type-2 domain-containing protein n=1 Tax=Owenia fusiformis TaxID=6347 RepID=A0A8S4P2V9_OWEFU|nr:unnamed protein product [Owenia fusiformis]
MVWTTCNKYFVSYIYVQYCAKDQQGHQKCINHKNIHCSTVYSVNFSNQEKMRTVLFTVLIAIVLAQDRPPSDRVVTTDPVECAANSGFLADEDRPGGDCCHFIQCDNTKNNKTGYVVACMYPLVWNKEIQACDDDLNLPQESTCYHSDCSEKPEPIPVCESNDEPADGECCIVGEPLFYKLFSEDSLKFYVSRTKGNDTFGDIEFCPGEQEFNLNDCCCEDNYIIMPECDGVNLFQLASDNCCQYNQCFQNKTGYWNKMCMGGSVFNPKIGACDVVEFVPECESDPCLDDQVMTEKPCPAADTLDEDQCCVAGVIFTEDSYFGVLGSYFVGDPTNLDNLNFCPQEQIFSVDSCRCEGDIEQLGCSCLHFTFENDNQTTDSLQGVQVKGKGFVSPGLGGTSGALAVDDDTGDCASIPYFSRGYLGSQFTLAFRVNAEGNIFSNGDDENPSTLNVAITQGNLIVDIEVGGETISLNGLAALDTDIHVAIVKDEQEMKLYVEGALVDTQPARGNYDPSDCPLKLCGQGIVDELVMCHFSYSQDLVRALADDNIVAANN